MRVQACKSSLWAVGLLMMGVVMANENELLDAVRDGELGRVQQLMADYRIVVTQLLDQAREERLLANDVDLPSAVVLFMGAVQGLVMQSLVTGNLHGLARQGKAVFKLYEAGLLPKPTT